MSCPAHNEVAGLDVEADADLTNKEVVVEYRRHAVRRLASGFCGGILDRHLWRIGNGTRHCEVV